MIPRMLAIIFLALTPLAAHAQDGWLLLRGNAQRTGAASKLPAWEKRPAWQRPLLMDKLEGFPDPDQPAKELIENLRKDADPTILPGSFPIIVEDACYYRSYRDVRAVALQEIVHKIPEFGEEFKTPARQILWKTIPLRASLSVLLEKNQTRAAVPTLVKLLQTHKQDRWVWANPTIGSLSSNGNTVFMIDDFAFTMAEQPQVGIKIPEIGAMARFMAGNELCAYDAQTGKLRWNTGDLKPPFQKTFFRSAPLPSGGKLYVLNQKKDELRLLSMDLDWRK
jgi:hypothetical protein